MKNIFFIFILLLGATIILPLQALYIVCTPIREILDKHNKL